MGGGDEKAFKHKGPHTEPRGARELGRGEAHPQCSHLYLKLCISSIAKVGDKRA